MSVYKITTATNPELCYIGSTKQNIRARFIQHKYCKGIVYDKLISLYDDCVIELIEGNIPYNLLRKKEGGYIKGCININKNIAGQTLKEYYNANRDKILYYQKKYNEANRDKIRDYQREYTIIHKERRREYNKTHYNPIYQAVKGKERYTKNKDAILIKRKAYYQANKERLKEYNNARYKLKTKV